MKHDPQTDEHQTLEDLLPNSDDIARVLDRDAADETLRRFREHAAHNPRLAEAVADFNQVRDAALPSPQPAPQRPAQGPPPLPAPSPDQTLPSMGSLHRDPNQHTTQAFGTPGKLARASKGDTLRMLHAGGTSPEAVALAAHTPTMNPALYSPNHNANPPPRSANYSATPFQPPAATATATAAAAPTPAPAPPAPQVITVLALIDDDPSADPQSPTSARRVIEVLAQPCCDSGVDPPTPTLTRPGEEPSATPGLDALRAMIAADEHEHELRRAERQKLIDYKNARSAEIAAREAGAAASAQALDSAAASHDAPSGPATQNSPAQKGSASPSPSPSSSSGKEPGKDHASPWKTNGFAAIPIDKAALPSAHAPSPTPAPKTATSPASKPASERKPSAASGTYPQRRVVTLVLASIALPVLVWLLLSQLMSTEPEVPSGPAAGSPSRGVEVDPQPTAAPSTPTAEPTSTGSPEPTAAPTAPTTEAPATEAPAPTAAPTIATPRPKMPGSAPGRTATTAAQPAPPGTATTTTTAAPPETAAPVTPPAPTFTPMFPPEGERN